MRVVNIKDYIKKEPLVVALGNFDGVHRGHMSLLEETVRMAKELAAVPTVYTFSTHPKNVLAGKLVSPSVTTNVERVELFKRCGIELVVMDPFLPETSGLSPVAFVEDLIFEKLGTIGVVCGFHYHFGAKGQGDAPLLLMLCADHGAKVSVMPPVLQDGRVISSSWIRECITNGNVGLAAELMGHPFTLCATVVEGRKLGRRLGVPTMNQLFIGKICPSYGVYYTEVCIDGKRYAGATNVGVRPTVSGHDPNAETHVIDFSGDLYGKEIEISFIRKLRDERKFDSVEDLKEQLEKDVARCRAIAKKELVL